MRFVLPSVFDVALPRCRITHPRRLETFTVVSAAGDAGVKQIQNGARKPETTEATVKAAPVSSKKPTAKAVSKKAASGPKVFNNRNKFVVPAPLTKVFEDIWEHRRSLMESSKGFQELKINSGSLRKDGSKEITVSSTWASVPEWEAYSCSYGARRSHLPPGIYQYVPKKGEGFPEDFTPFIEYADAVNAKY